MRFLRILRLTLTIFVAILFSACWGKQSNVPKGNGSGFTGIIKGQGTSSTSIAPKSKQVNAPKLTNASNLKSKNYSKSNSANALDYIAPEMGIKVKTPEITSIAWEKSAKTASVKYQKLNKIEIPVDSIESLEKSSDETIGAEEVPLPNTVATAESKMEKAIAKSPATMAPSLVAQSDAQDQSSESVMPATPSEKVIFWAQKNEENKLVEKMGAVKLPEGPYQHPVQDVWDTYQQDELATLLTDDFTISASFRFISTDKPNFLFQGPSFQLVYMFGRLEFRYMDPGSTPSQRKLSVPLTIKMGSTHRIQIVRTHSTLRLYLDGQQVDETTIDCDFSALFDLNKLYLFSPEVRQRAQIEFDEVKITLP